MSSSLNEMFRAWIGRIAGDWGVSIDIAVKHLGANEASNRVAGYPALARASTSATPNMDSVWTTAQECWPLDERWLRRELKEFCAHPGAATVLGEFILSFPGEDGAAASRIDGFVEEFAAIGHGKRDKAGLFASCILTASFPDRFVDFVNARWSALGQELKYDLPLRDAAYGKRIVAAGKFAKSVTQTSAFGEWWPTDHPLWTIAGICWHGMSSVEDNRPNDPLDFPPLDFADLPPLEFDDKRYKEGGLKLYLHLRRERNEKLVRDAKEQWKRKDPSLRCEVCRFSFLEHYGELGEHFIEAHHHKPLAKTMMGTETRIEDLAPVCANCHRMLHRDEGMSIEKLRKQLLTKA